MSLAESDTVNELGTTVPPRTPTDRLSSIDADEPATELHGTEAALERARERALHQALQPAFEPPDTHRREAIGRTGTGWGDPEGER